MWNERWKSFGEITCVPLEPSFPARYSSPKLPECKPYIDHSYSGVPFVFLELAYCLWNGSFYFLHLAFTHQSPMQVWLASPHHCSGAQNSAICVLLPYPWWEIGGSLMVHACEYYMVGLYWPANNSWWVYTGQWIVHGGFIPVEL